MKLVYDPSWSLGICLYECVFSMNYKISNFRRWRGDKSRKWCMIPLDFLDYVYINIEYEYVLSMNYKIPNFVDEEVIKGIWLLLIYGNTSIWMWNMNMFFSMNYKIPNFFMKGDKGRNWYIIPLDFGEHAKHISL